MQTEIDSKKMEFFDRYIDIKTRQKAWIIVGNRYGQFGRIQKEIEKLGHDEYNMTQPKGKYMQAFGEYFYIDFYDWFYNVLTELEQKKLEQKRDTESQELAEKIVKKLKEDDVL